MMKKKPIICAESKVSAERQRVEDYLSGKEIFPTTMEVDLSQICSRACRGCPYSASRKKQLSLDMPFIDRLFSVLGGNVPGLILSGGEPTIAPTFSSVLQGARKNGFKTVGIISNGSNLTDAKVMQSMLEYASVIRVSLYDWQNGEAAYFLRQLEGIKRLRAAIENTGSKLEIGVSMLTCSEWNDRYMDVTRKAIEAGAHWIYFHPYCIDWDIGAPVYADQDGVMEMLEKVNQGFSDVANIQIPYDRYLMQTIKFNKLYGGYFLIEVGADGNCYVGPECKYDERYVLTDLREKYDESFLWSSERISALEELNSNNYTYVGSRHRPVMISNYIQKVIDGTISIDIQKDLYRYPELI